MQQKLQRNIALTFRVTEGEREMIRRRQAQTGIQNLRAYLLKMAIDGRVIEVKLNSVKEMNRLLSNIAGNINQIAKRANQTGQIYDADITEIKTRQEEIWTQQSRILDILSKIVEGV